MRYLSHRDFFICKTDDSAKRYWTNSSVAHQRIGCVVYIKHFWGFMMLSSRCGKGSGVAAIAFGDEAGHTPTGFAQLAF